MIRPFMSFKVCPACGENKPRTDYYKKGETISYRCKPCTKIELRARAPKYFGKYSDYQNQWRRDRYKNDPEYRAKIAEQKKHRYDAKRDEKNAARRHRWATDPKNPARLYHRRKDVKKRQPRWADKKALLRIYADCPAGMHVDHIIPLKGVIDGRPVSGLHVPWNLQYLTPEENRKKRNRIMESDIIGL